MSDAFNIRFATAADLEMISHHRARMFADMGELPPEMFDSFRAKSLEALREMFDRRQYVGWLAASETEPGKIVAGAGVFRAKPRRIRNRTQTAGSTSYQAGRL
jgi:hypothetical protein